MVALCNRAYHYIVALWFLLLSFFFFFSSPNLSRRRLDVYHTYTHSVALVRISDAGLKHAARGSLKMQDAKKSPQTPSGHHRTTLLGYIFATKARIHNGKKILSINSSSTYPHNIANFSPLMAEIGWPGWGTPANFNRFRVLTALLHGIPVVDVSQTLRRHLYLAGRPSSWALAYISICFSFFIILFYLVPCGRLSWPLVIF